MAVLLRNDEIFGTSFNKDIYIYIRISPLKPQIRTIKKSLILISREVKATFPVSSAS